ncbi:Carboxylesterase, type B [Beauveria brongniartii RCEF 3172]|uniref:Carboxylic ester hydrolase n=1 Tax=Beauveria brongniartii RCEF 3172 TaxID=1081107 RepID=A0A162HUB8_9HYPO|nr:Carboxylesterase, type B [Beauveria brongniartii RCEF 3172]
MKSISLASVILFLPGFVVSAANSSVLPSAGEEVTVETPSGTIIGAVTGVENFNGIPFAKPPVGELRLRPPVRLTGNLGVFNATGKALGCPQMPPNSGKVLLPPLGGQDVTPPIWDEDGPPKGVEDCLTVTVQRPRGTRADANLPVLFYIFGGAFMFGATNVNDAEKFITFAEQQDQGFIFVGVNYRLGGFGFLGGSEILKEKSTNLGLRDQRMGLEWVADNIAYFGGNPRNVTLWGQSAGSISVFDQMALYNGNATYNDHPLFHGAILNSGSVLPTERVDSQKAQAIFDKVVEAANCTWSKVSQLECLRSLEYKDFYRAANSVPRVLDRSSLALSYLPRPDDELLLKSPDAIADAGTYYAVPTIITSQEDEGTFFSFAQIDLNNTESLVNYLSELFFDRATRSQVAELVDTYPLASANGSPFRTLLLNEWYRDHYRNGNGFKRVAALLGDFVFTLVRRLALQGMATSHPDVSLWSSLNSVAYGALPYWGTPHGTDVGMIFNATGPDIAVKSTRTYYLNFIHHLDPNKGVQGYLHWPKWTPNGKQLLWTTKFGNMLENDTFREESYEYLKNNTRAFYF